MRKITVSDYTLRKLCEDGYTSLLFREKVAVSSCLDTIGASKIELPAVKKVKEDSIINKTIASNVNNSILAIPAGYSEEEIDTAWESIMNADKPCLQIMLPVATAQMEYNFRAKESAMIENIAKLVSYAKTKCSNVEFIAQDATRAGMQFLVSACKTAFENGASEITLCDDAGVSLPEDTAAMVSEIKSSCTVPVNVTLNDSISMAAACAVAAIKAGVDGVKTSMIGSNVLLTEKFAEVIGVKGADMGVETSLKMTELHRDVHEILKYIGKENSADTASDAVSGSPDIFLDSNSSFADLCEAVKTLGYDLKDEDNGKVYLALLRVCERKESVGAKELEALIASNALQAPSTYHLETFSVNCTNVMACMAQITLKKMDELISGVASGDGPIDAAFKAIEQSIGYHYELDDFQIQAVTEGKEALGSALVRLRYNGKLYSGNGLSTDIVGASIRAYINALNKIVYEEN